jgi:HEAT repeat protein
MLLIARTFMRPLISPLVLLLLAALATGCGSPRRELGRLPRPPKPPPAVPPARDVPLDPQLLAAARRELDRAATSDAPQLRANAIEAIRDVLGTNPAALERGTAIQTILAGLVDPAAGVRFAAALAAGELQLAEAGEQVRALADDASPSVRVAARFALHRLGDTTLSHDLEQTALDPDPAVRARTALVLGLLGEPSGIKVLRPMRADPSPVVRVQAHESLWRLGDEEGLRSVIAGTVSGYPDDQMVSLLALAAPRDRRVIEHARAALTGDYLEVNLVAARAVGILGSDDGYGVALRGVNSPDPRQRMLAALAFGAIGRTDAQDKLGKLLKDPEPEVRLAAALALLQLKSA